MILLNRLFIVILLAFAFAYPANASGGTIKNYTVSLIKMNGEARLKLAQYLLENKQADKAIQTLIFKPFKTANFIVQSQILLADSLFILGKKTNAVDVLRKLLAAQPENSIARFKLAQMLFSMGENSGAKHHLEILRSSLRDEKSQQIIQNQLTQIAHKKDWFFGLSGSYFPRSNFNNGVVKDVYYCNDFGATPNAVEGWRQTFANILGQNCDAGIITPANQKAQNGWVLDVTAQAGNRFRINDKTSWLIKATGRLIKYPHTIADVGVLSINTGSIISLDKNTKLIFDAKAELTVSAGKVSQRNLAFSGEISYIFNPQVTATGALTLSQLTHYNDADQNNVTANLQTNLRLSLDNTSFVRLIAGAKKSRAQNPNNSFTAFNGGVGYYKELPLGVTLYVQSNLELRNKNLENIKDFNLSAKFTKRDLNLWGFAPELSVNYLNYNSTINRFDKKGSSINIGFTKSF